MTAAYYNEIDPNAAQWLRNLIAIGAIADGEVDERDIRDIEPRELMGFTQCHFFAGIGVWSYALRIAGWPDERPVWTGSPPCQPFSAAGRRGGVADERHLWPHWHHLIRECGPQQIFGEQVASKDGLSWLDLVQADMEGTGYAGGAVDLCAAGVGAPHIRQRQFFFFTVQALGHSDGPRAAPGLPEPSQREEGHAEVDDDRSDRLLRPGEGRSPTDALAYGDCGEWQGWADLPERNERRGPHAGRSEDCGDAQQHGGDGGLADDTLGGRQRGTGLRDCEPRQRGQVSPHHEPVRDQPGRPGPTNGRWGDADWLFCRDGKWRPVEPGTFPLVDGATFGVDSGSAFAGKSRAAMLKGAGNAIVSEAAAAVVAAFLESEADGHGAPASGRGDVSLIEDLL